MKTVTVIVSPEGASRVETNGFTGDQCRQASAFLEEALGLKENEQLKADFYKTEVRDQQQARQSS
ncbi:DUF2997 domain-containing protein [Rubripirellula reticaptiva]|uniref:DUF2997 domain-containing protein n=1 Tax=Rubripirellula reticaptiva TaxID=2528013 RepID=A0A5C6ES25_9BACT|nr:DUF2997 domain-containing protein [Rubripirellula reticaptiva]TWU51154.1 hypothetical protein Poly59_27440 [Rubripirellula reticaptiva]